MVATLSVCNSKTQNVTISFIFLNQGSSGRLNTICLPFDAAPGEKYVAETLTVTGWGYTEVDSKGVRSDILLLNVALYICICDS